MTNSIVDRLINAILGGRSVEDAYRDAKLDSARNQRFTPDFDDLASMPALTIGYIVKSEGLPSPIDWARLSTERAWKLANVPDPKCVAAKLAEFEKPTRDQIETAFRDCAEQ